MHATAHAPQLIDRFDRHVSYVRISVTDRCDFRCVYCMSEDMTFVPRDQVLTLEEIVRLGTAFCELGVTKIRVLWVFEQLGMLNGLDDLTLTTNGSQLEKLAHPLRKAGVKRINISLDSLKPERFREITRTGDLQKVLRGIEAAQDAGFRIKLNTVAMKGRNHDEILGLVQFAVDRGMDISFIEEMPLGVIAEHDRAEVYYSSDAVRRDIQTRFELIPTTETTGGPSKYYKVVGSQSRVGFISPHSHNFCSSCNRVRVTTEGRLLLCLGQEHSLDLRQVLRRDPGDDDGLKQAIIGAMAIKPKGHDFNLSAKPVIVRYMNMTGG